MTNKPRPQLQPGETRAYPVLPLRDIVVFPHMIVPLFVGREKSIKALEEVMRSDTFILLATQKNASDDDPATDAIFETGTLASVLQLLKLPDGTVDTLLKPENKKKLTGVLTYHVVAGKLTAKDLMAKVKKGGGEAKLKTVEGEMLTVKMKDGKLWVIDGKGDTAQVTIGDVMQSNGVIHVVDTVLLPS